jgi:hypothetical protein
MARLLDGAPPGWRAFWMARLLDGAPARALQEYGMESQPLSSENRPRPIVLQRSFLILAAMLMALTALHYFTPQARPLFLTPYVMERHAIERIVFLMPIAGATFAFGQVGGWITLLLSILIMLPRALFLSPYPGDALAETAAVGVVGYFVIWMIQTQENEKRLRQKAVLRLRTLNASPRP